MKVERLAINPEESPSRSILTEKTSESLRWSNKHKAYIASRDLIPIDVLLVDKEAYHNYEAGNYLAIYPEYDKESMLIDCHGSYARLNSDEYLLHVYKKEIINELPYGSFSLGMTPDGNASLKPLTNRIKSSNILIPTYDLKGHVLNFFAKEHSGVRKKKSGCLLFGPPGNSKTTQIMIMSEVAETEKFRTIFLLNSDISIHFLGQLKPLLENQPTVFVIEEITERLGRRNVEELLTFLDGETSWNNSITIATTNYPEQLPANLVDRPGRFETFVKFDNPTRIQVREMLDAAGLVSIDADDFFKGKSFSFDYVSHIISVILEKGLSVSEVIKSEETKRKMLSETFKGSIGFGG